MAEWKQSNIHTNAKFYIAQRVVFKTVKTVLTPKFCNETND